jgi:hypothetical protein
MMMAGVAYFSPHRVVETLAPKYTLHLFRYYVKKPHKGRKKKVETVSVEDTKNAEEIDSLKKFLPGLGETPKILLVDGIESFFAIRKAFKLERNRKSLYGIIIFDNPSNLFDYSIPVLDAERVQEGMWWKRKDFLEKTLLKEVKARSGEKTNPAKIKPIRRAKISDWVDPKEAKHGEVRGSNKARGFISHFIQGVKVHVAGEDVDDKSLLRIVLGFFLGVESKPDYIAAVKTLLTHGVLKKQIRSLEKYAKTKHGSHLISVFYLSQKGKSFANLQREFKGLVMDDWLVLQEYVPSTTKHKFFRKPDVG